MKTRLLMSAICLLTTCSAWGAGPLEREIQLELQAPNMAGYFAPQQTLTLQLSPLSSHSSAHIEEVLEGVSIELDGIDVTGLVTLANNQGAAFLHYTPAQRLAFGQHLLRAVRYGPDGEVNELGYWEFDVRYSSRVANVEAQSQLDITANQQIARGSDPAVLQSYDSFSAQGVGQFNGLVEGDEWGVEGNASLALADDAAQSLTGREVDIPYFTVTAKRGRYGVALGDQNLMQPSLLSNGFQQRGVASSMALPALDSAITAYAVAANQRVGLDGGLGINDSNNRLSGVSWQAQPWQSPRAEVYLEANYVSGKASQPDYASINFNPQAAVVHAGNAWNLVVDSLFMQRQVRVRLESAKTEYDFDGEGGYAAENDDAWSTLVVFQPSFSAGETGGRYRSETVFDTTLGIEAKQVGRFYHSLINGQMPADKRFQRLFFNGSASQQNGQWFWESAYSTETNNLEKVAAYAITDVSQWALSGGYSAYQPFDDGSLWRWLGLPSYNWAARGVTIKDKYTPTGYIANDVDTDTVNANAVFAYSQWNWSVGVSEETLTDHSGWQPNTQTRALNIGSAKQFGDRVYASAGWQWQQTYYLAQQQTTRRQLLNVDVSAQLVPKVLRATFNMGANQNRAANDPFYAMRDQSTYASVNLIWHVREPKHHRAGLNVSISVSHNDYTDQLVSLNNASGYQAFLKVSTSLPSVFPGAGND